MKNVMNTEDFLILKQSKEFRDQCMLEMNNKFNQIDQDILKETEQFVSFIEQDISKHQKIVRELEKKHEAFFSQHQKKKILYWPSKALM